MCAHPGAVDSEVPVMFKLGSSLPTRCFFQLHNSVFIHFLLLLQQRTWKQMRYVLVLCASHLKWTRKAVFPWEALGRIYLCAFSSFQRCLFSLADSSFFCLWSQQHNIFKSHSPIWSLIPSSHHLFWLWLTCSFS